MSIFRREQRSGPFPQPIIAPFPGMSMFNQPGAVSIESAMQTAAVWACVRKLTDTVSMMPLSAYTMRGGTRVQIASPPLLVSPSDDATMPEWIEMLMVSALLRGNAYGRITARDNLQWPAAVEILNPDQVQPRVDPDSGRLVYSTNGAPLVTKDTFHFRAYRMPGSQLGLSPIAYAARTIQTDAAIGEFGYGFFRDGAHPSSILSSDITLNQEQARTVKERFMSAVKGREPAVLSGGLKYQAIQISPEESQFLETQKLGDLAIARIFGVPPVMVGMSSGDSMSYSNDNQRVVDFLTFSVQTWLTRIETAISALLPGQKHVRFDPSVLLRTDLETLIKTGAIAIASKQNTPDEVRAWNDYPPLTPEQKAWLEVIPLTVSPSGMPKALPKAPAAVPATEGEPAA